MPSSETVERFIARVEQNAHAEAIEEFYTVFASMQENLKPPRIGRDALVARERKVMARARSVHSQCVRPVFISGNHVVVRWRFRFEWLDGSTSEMEELAWQRWDGERIDEEQFFYDPAQAVPRQPGAADASGAAGV
ncbi:MAG: nuclear transport factor 2 family protein [Rhodoferax sp.]|jgi:hypothetical protein|nr:nuclear transport factor 2 family protein [Rhodoferax sp.]MBP9929963.1 nuclear transport factor 2 family protein [Rhodoferax sp.]HQZ04292.1 nuclear transport factor 2 family protein [Burkholderiaceae bacterium]